MALSMELNQKVDARKERLAVVGEMAGDMVHDLRNMLTSIRGAAELLALRGGSQQLVDIILNQSTAMQQMADDVMAFCRGEERFAPETVNVGEFVADVLAGQGSRFTEAGVAVQLETDSREVSLDRVQMQRALLNLLVNAIDAMPDGGLIKVRAVVEHEALLLSVEDTGQGMEPATVARLFEPFFTSGKPQGTGLGGAVVKAVADAHGGTVSVASELGRGTRVSLVIPNASPMGETVAQPDSRPRLVAV